MTGNNPLEETTERAILTAATGRLVAALPPAWSVTADTPEMTPWSPWRPDAQLTIAPPQGPSVTMTVEVRRLDRVAS